MAERKISIIAFALFGFEVQIHRLYLQHLSALLYKSKSIHKNGILTFEILKNQRKQLDSFTH